MPYSSNKELPESTRGLPEKAKDIFRAAFNAAHKNTGSEERAFKVAWAAVKRKYRKKGEQWVLKAGEGDPMAGLISQLQTILGWSTDPSRAGVRLAAKTLLQDAASAAETRPEDVPCLVERSAVLVEDLVLAQMHDSFPGSLDSRITHVRRALREAKTEGKSCHLMAAYADYAVIAEMDYWDWSSDMKHYKVPYSFDDASGKVEFGEYEEVDIHTIVVPKDAPVEEEAERPRIDVRVAEVVEQDDETPLEQLTQTITMHLQAKGKDEKTGVMHIEGIATVGNVLNSNDQIYPTEVWEENMPRLQSLLEEGKLLGEADHPITGRRSLDRTCIKFTKIWQKEDEFKFKADILPTEVGLNLQTLLQHDVSVDISSWGYGRQKVQDWKHPKTGVVYKGKKVIQKGFRCDYFDAVLRGASPGSTITGWSQTQSDVATDPTQEELEMDPETLKALVEQMQQQAAATAETNKLIAQMIEKQAGNEPPAPKEEPDPATPIQQGLSDDEITRQRELAASMEKMLVNQRIDQLVQTVIQTHKWGPQWVTAYRSRLVKADCKNVGELEKVHGDVTELIQSMVDAAPKYPSLGHSVQKDRGERGPKTVGELLDKMVEFLPDKVEEDPFAFMYQDEESGEVRHTPDCVKSPRRQLRKYLQNMAEAVDPESGWNGPASILALWRLEQGYDPTAVQENLQKMTMDQLAQVCADGSTNVGAGGAPQSTIFLFPLVRRVFPQLIATELASVQPMDRPEGKIFYLDAYRISTGVDSLDEGGNTISDRMRIDRSDSFSDSYSNDPGECESANYIQLRLSSKSVTAVTKKLQALWSIEEVQDLRAYHGLDASSELLNSLSIQIALEWNEIMLKEMLLGATAGNRIFGTTAPSGYTQKEWDEYLPRYVDAASNDIFQKRNGDMTHIVAGPTAWLKMAATHRVGTMPAGTNPNQFAGLTLVPFMGISAPNVRTYKTSFWTKSAFSNKILVIRRGDRWSDTPYVWAPYIDYVSPILTSPDVFTQRQGIMSRAAKKVVISDAMSTITVQTGVTGAPV